MKTKKETQRDALYERITAHGKKVNALFRTDHDPIELFKKLRRLEKKMTAANVAYCNGAINGDEWDIKTEIVRNALIKLLGAEIPIYINGDPRGYALQLPPERAGDLITDWGGHGLLAPDLTND